MSLALSNKTVAGTAASSGAQTGFSVDLTGAQPGNPLTISYTSGGVTRQAQFVEVCRRYAVTLAEVGGGRRLESSGHRLHRRRGRRGGCDHCNARHGLHSLRGGLGRHDSRRRCRWHDRRQQCFGLDHLDNAQRQRGRAATLRRCRARHALHRDVRRRIPEDGLCRPHRGQQGRHRQPRLARPIRSVDPTGRSGPSELHPRGADQDRDDSAARHRHRRLGQPL